MEIILKTSKKNSFVATGYDKDIDKFITIYRHEDKQSVLDTFTSLDEMVSTHDFWCKIAGLIPVPFNRSEVNLHAKQLKTS